MVQSTAAGRLIRPPYIQRIEDLFYGESRQMVLNKKNDKRADVSVILERIRQNPLKKSTEALRQHDNY